MTNSKSTVSKQTTPARKAMIKALKLTLAGNTKAAKKELTKANRLLNVQYSK
jgi:cellobiose-specific phosphotransferase system component IIA